MHENMYTYFHIYMNTELRERNIAHALLQCKRDYTTFYVVITHTRD